MPESHSLKMESNIPVPMRDGTPLYADVLRPEGPGPFPVLLERTPYDKTMPTSLGMLDAIRAAKRGYAVVLQDTRGRYASQGEFYAFRDDVNDGYDTVEWAASQPWSTGKVGMYGASYVGATQWQAAKSVPPQPGGHRPQRHRLRLLRRLDLPERRLRAWVQRVLDHAGPDPGQHSEPLLPE